MAEVRKIVIVEDDRDLNSLLKYTLEASGEFQVHSCFEGDAALGIIENTSPELVILDVMLPGMSGTEVLTEVRRRKEYASLPIIMLTARSLESDRIEGFEMGADDYITKPFSPKELILRVQALLRRSHPKLTSGVRESSQVESESTRLGPDLSAEKSLRFGELIIFPALYRVEVTGDHIPLTSTEFQLLMFLAERPGRLQSRELLLQRVWGYEGNVNTRTVDTHVKRLRQKLGSAGSLIHTVHGFGYQLLNEQ
jgi:DNA-binding response OmpR family regulator